MKLESFIGGTDEQRSNNLSDNQLINLYPTTNNDGSIAAFYKVDGLKSEGTLSGVPTGAYKASNGRAFYTSGTVLYELTVPAGVYTSTSRGTITTATNYEFSDNGLEMIMVNGTDGWIFTFSTNALLKLTVLTDTFTVQTATASDVDATLTQTAHGLIVGDRVILTTTGSLPTYLLPNTAYYVLADGFTTDAFKVGLTLTGATCTISNGTPCTVTSASHNFIAGDKLRFLTTGALPSPLAAGTIYYVIAAGITQDTFRISLTSGGTAINTTTAGSGTHSFNPAITIIQAASSVCSISSTSAVGGACTISYASPTVITKATHGLVGGEIIKFPSSTLPGGITQYIPYYVLSSGLTTDTFKISLTDGGDAVNTSSAGSGTFSYVVTPSGYISTITDHLLNIGDPVYFSTSGALPTNITSNTEYFITGNGNVTFDLGYITTPYQPFAGWRYTCGLRMYSTDPLLTVSIGQKIKFKSNGALPTIIEEGVEYVLGTTPYDGYYSIIDDGTALGSVGEIWEASQLACPITTGLGNGLHTFILQQNFAVVTTLPEIFGTRVTISGTQSGVHSYFQEGSVAYGTHTYTTAGSGFPSGAKTVSYMNGRFIACDPDTQDFYVSEVLDGKTWDAINVQTVDSNPDYVTGQIVAHNELFVFCENSGETYYDSGTTPTPFVRNLTGIFEVGCITPYTIQDVSGQIIFLGNSKNGSGIVYKMTGLTPVRISTYSIEYQIQQMSDISDARAFTYQKDGHHFYVLTFPTGDKTFVFDASTSLWHERERTIPSTTTPTVTWTPQTSGIINQSTNDAAWNGTVFCAIGRTTAGGATDQCYTSTDGITWTARTMPSSQTWWAIAWNGTVFCAIAGGQFSSDVAATSTDGITWTARTLSASQNWYDIAWNGTLFCAVATTGSTAATSPDGITWTGRTLVPSQGYFRITSDGSSFIATGLNTNKLSKSADGITWASVTLPVSGAWSAMGWNGTNYLITEGSTHVSISPSSVALTSPDGATWTQRALPETAGWSDIDVINGVFTIINVTNNNTYSSLDGITWTLSAISGSVADFYNITNNLTNFVTIGNGNPAITAISNAIVLNTPAYAEWPANKYLYFNSEHLITDDTTTLFSIDSSTYKNGTAPIRIVRSFRAPSSNMKRVAHHTIQIDCEVGIGAVGLTEPVIALRWSDDAGNTWSTAMERGLGLVGDHAKTVIFRRLGSTKGIPRIYELSCDENVKITLLDCYLE